MSVRIDVDVGKAVTAQGRTFRLDVRFSADAERTIVFGPSGAGKTLLMQMLAGFVRPDRGSIRVDGEPWFDSARGIEVPARRRNVGVVFQDYALFPHRTVRDNVAAALASGVLGGIPRVHDAHVEQLLAAFDVADIARSFPAQISGGQRQRVALARALAKRPCLLLVDEPFSALDAPLRSRVRDELVCIQSRYGIPLVMVTHDPEDVAMFGECIVGIEHGRVIEVKCAHPVHAQSSNCVNQRHRIDEARRMQRA